MSSSNNNNIIDIIDKRPGSSWDIEKISRDLASTERNIGTLKDTLEHCTVDGKPLYTIAEEPNMSSNIISSGSDGGQSTKYHHMLAQNHIALELMELTNMYMTKQEESEAVTQKLAELKADDDAKMNLENITKYLDQASHILETLEENQQLADELQLDFAGDQGADGKRLTSAGRLMTAGGMSTASSHSQPPISITNPREKIRSSNEILQDIKLKLNLLRTDEPEFDALLDRIIAYRAEMSKLRVDFSAMSRYDRALAAETHATKLQERIKAAKERSKKIIQERERSILNQIRIKTIGANVGKPPLHMTVDQAKRRLWREKWFILIIIGSRMYRLQQFLVNEQRDIFQRLQRVNAAKTIQRSYRDYKQRLRFAVEAGALIIITKFIKRVRPRIDEMMRRKAANTVVDFIRKHDSSCRLVRLARQYRFIGVKCQRAMRTYLNIKHAQIELMMLEWDRYEPVWWQRRCEAMQKNNRRQVNVSSEKTQIVPAKIRLELITTDWHRRRQEYRLRFYEHLKSRKDWNDLQQRKQLIANVVGGQGSASSSAHHQHHQQQQQQVSYVEISPVIGLSTEIPGLLINMKTSQPVLMSFRALLGMDKMIEMIDQGFAIVSRGKYTAPTMNMPAV